MSEDRMKGCVPSHPGTLMRAVYLPNLLASLPPPPKTYDCFAGFRGFKMFLNDRLSDCVVARFANATLGLTFAATGTAVSFNDSDIKENYFAQTGGWDTGLPLDKALAYWNQFGLKDSTGKLHKPGIYGGVDPRIPEHVDYAAYYFQGLDAAISTPRSFMNSGDGDVIDWNSASSPGPLEHCVGLGGINADGNRELITWGGIRWATPRFIDACVGELWAAPKDNDRLRPDGKTIDGWDQDELDRQWAIFAGVA